MAYAKTECECANPDTNGPALKNNLQKIMLAAVQPTY